MLLPLGQCPQGVSQSFCRRPRIVSLQIPTEPGGGQLFHFVHHRRFGWWSHGSQTLTTDEGNCGGVTDRASRRHTKSPIEAALLSDKSIPASKITYRLDRNIDLDYGEYATEDLIRGTYNNLLWPYSSDLVPEGYRGGKSEYLSSIPNTLLIFFFIFYFFP